MKPNDLHNNSKPITFSEEQRKVFRDILRESLVSQYGEHWVAIHEMESRQDVEEAEARISAIQGPSPRDKAWPLQPWDPEPPHEPGWDSGNRLNFAAAKQVYDEYVAKDKIIQHEINVNDSTAETDSKGL